MAFRATRALFSQTAQAAKPKVSGFKKNWLSDSATYPVMYIMIGATGLVLFQGQRILFNHPDITVDKEERATSMRENDEEALEHYNHPLRKYAQKGNTQIMAPINNAIVSSKVRDQ